MSRIADYFSLVKFSHTLFALPFALIGYAYGVTIVGFDIWTLAGVLFCMVFARNAAMGFNRLVDRRYDAENPRTAPREIPSGKISSSAATWFVAVNVVGFVVAAGTLNRLCLYLSPVALLVILGYSYTKRFTSFCHLVLGLGLAIAPSAAYMAVTGRLDDWFPPLVSVLVLTWVTGFDIIYALQDAEFDREQGLHSIPARLGIHGALWVSGVLHIMTAAIVAGIGYLFYPFDYIYWLGAAIFLILMSYQHWIVRPSDLSRINPTFGTLNGVASVIYATFVIAAQQW